MKKSLKHLLAYSPLSIYFLVRERKERIRKIKTQQDIIKKYFEESKVHKLQIGSGANYLQGWLNTDLNYNSQVAYLNAGEIFPLKSESFDFIFSEHLFEHLNMSQQINMLKESYRVLKKGGVMRLATPSLDFLFNLYKEPNSPDNLNYVKWAVSNIPKLKEVKKEVKSKDEYYCYVINNFFKDWGHQMIHNFSSLKQLTFQYGFNEIKICEVNQSEFSDLQNIERHGEVIPQEMNIIETMVLEIKKL